MHRINFTITKLTLLVALLALPLGISAKTTTTPDAFCFWYWMYGHVSKEGIHADLVAMKNAGLRGTYLMPIRGTEEAKDLPALKGGYAQQLTPQFWEMVRYAMQQCDSLGLELGVHVCDGFALGGGPWFTEEESMQKVKTIYMPVAPKAKSVHIDKIEGFHDIAVFAVPCKDTVSYVKPVSILGSDGKELSNASTSTNPLINLPAAIKSPDPYSFVADFGSAVDVRAIEITPQGLNVQCHRLKIEISNDNVNYQPLATLKPAKQGWQDYLYPATHALPSHEASRYYRFSWTPEGTEPGSEDLDAGKWKPNLAIKNMVFHHQPLVNQWEGKAGFTWRQETTDYDNGEYVALNDIVRLEVDAEGNVILPKTVKKALKNGTVRLLRMGHVSTGLTNATAGGAKGLEGDKFSEAAVNKLLDNWFGKFYEISRKEMHNQGYLHVDSWECGTQNWSKNFPAEFAKRRGYDLMPWLPIMAGVPVESREATEKVLRDIRLTINDLINDVFFATVRKRAKEMGMTFTSEATAPTMIVDGMEHYRYSDIPMGEFWLNSPTHDKPNDVFDAVSGAHIYGKNIVAAEGCTELRGVWDEMPMDIKTLIDRNFCLGINRLFFHVNTHNPWTDLKPGMTLDGIGLFFQRDQTWFPEARPMVDYVNRCSQLLQMGSPVADIAIYNGEDMPRRALRPEQTVSLLPGLYGKERIKSEEERLANVGQPLEESPVGVKHSANIAVTRDWINPLHGYQFDTVNPDVLKDATVSPVTATVPDASPSGSLATVPATSPSGSLATVPESSAFGSPLSLTLANGRHYALFIKNQPYTAEDLTALGLPRDADLPEDIAYTHRTITETGKQTDIYFLSNQREEQRSFLPCFRAAKAYAAGEAVIYDAVSDTFTAWNCDSITMAENASCFVIFTKQPVSSILPTATPATVPEASLATVPESFAFGSPASVPEASASGSSRIKGPVTMEFLESDTTITATADALPEWTASEDQRIKYFSGHCRYTFTLDCGKAKGRKAPALPKTLRAEGSQLFHVIVNGTDCGIAWTYPFRVNIAHALHAGENKIEVITVTPWANAIQGMDEGKAPYSGIWTNAKYRRKDKTLLPSGITRFVIQ